MKTYEEKEKFLINYANLLKNAWFDVYAPKKTELHPRTTYFYAVKDGKIAYIQSSTFGFECVDISTVHMRNARTGTGYKVQDMASNPSVAMAEYAANMIAPNYASQKDIESVQKFRDWEHYLKIEGWCEFEKI